MLIFENPGLIEKDAISIVGISAKLPDSIGRFGTGLKYSIGTILRAGGSITIYRGMEAIKIGTRAREIRDQAFDIVTLNGKNTGFATSMGRDWKPWMVLRELAANAMDEGGSYWQAEAFDASTETTEDRTTIIVEWDDLEAAYANRAELFLEGEPVLENDELRIIHKQVRYLYNRGIRVHELHEKIAAFAYDLKSHQTLTEDRTLLSPDQVKPAIAKAWLRCEDEGLLTAVLHGNQGYESALDFDQRDDKWQVIQPTRAFIDVCIAAREKGKLANKSAAKLLQKYLREEEASRTVGGGMSSHPVIEWLVDQASSMGFGFDEDKLKIVTVPELPGDSVTLFEKGRVYVLREALGQEYSRIALLQGFIMRLIESELAYPSYDSAMKLVLPKIMALRPSLKTMMDAEEKAAKEAAAVPAEADDVPLY